MTIQIKNILENILGQGNNNSWQLHLIKNWNSIIGKLATKVKLEKISNDTIVLGVYDSCWMQELYLLSDELLKKINSKLDEPKIKQIRFKQIGFKKAAIVKPRKNHFEFKKVHLSPKELYALKKISDPQLEEALKNFLVRCYSEKQYKS